MCIKHINIDNEIAEQCYNLIKMCMDEHSDHYLHHEKEADGIE